MCFLLYLTKDILNFLLRQKVSKSTLFGIDPTKRPYEKTFEKENEP